MADYDLIPKEGDAKVGEKVFEILGKVIADKIKLGLHDRWFRNHQLRRNQHWKAKSPAGVPLVSANLIYTHMQRTANTLTDNEPTFNVAGIGKTDEQQKEQLSDLQRCTEHWWRDQEQQDVFESSVINGEQYGIAIEKVVFNSNLEYNLGEAETIVVDPFHFGWYPCKLSFVRDIQKCEALLHYTPVSVRQLRAKYPKKAEKIKSDAELLNELKDDERREVIGEGSSGGSVMTTIASTVRELLNFTSGSTNEDDDEETLQCEMWVRDKTQVTEEVTDPQTGIITKQSRPKYTGEVRYILACTGGVVLEDKDNPNINKEMPEEQARTTYLYDKFPFSAVNSIKDTSNAWGLCYDDETEILTREHGFVRFADIRIGDEVATRNKAGEFEWQRPLKYTNEVYSGKMFHFKSRSVDLLVTPNHKMLVSMMGDTYLDRHEKTMTACELADGLNCGRKIPVTSSWKPQMPELTRMVFPKASMKPSRDLVMSGDDYCALLGAYLAEGNLHDQSGIEINQRKTSKGYAAYQELLGRLGASYDGKRFRLYSKALKDAFSVFGHAGDKHIPTSIKDLPVRQLKILWDHFVLGDGNFKKSPNVSGRGQRPKGVNNVTHITTVSRRLADDLVEIGQKLGWSVSVSITPAHRRFFAGCKKESNCQQAYKLCCRLSHYMGVKVEEINYNAPIRCVTVPNGIIYVRRNGKPAWCGNSDVEMGEPLNMEINKALSQFVVEKDRSARKKFINPMDSGVPDEHITNYVGILKPTNAMAAQGLRWVEPPQVSVDYEKAMALFKDFFFLVMGSFELDQAQVPGRDVIAYKAIAALMERAATMMRGKIRSYSRLIRDRGRMYLSHVMNFYTEERWITYKDEEGKESAKPIIGSSLVMPAKLTVVSGSTMPISRVQQREEALSLYSQRAIDQTELLDKLDWSNRAEVVKRMMAGPMGEVFEKLMTLQAPEPMIDYIKAVAEMDPKDLEKAIKNGEFPPFLEFMQKLMADMGGQPVEEQPDPEVAAKVKEIESKIAVNMANVEETKATIAHTMAEVDLTKEQAVTERVKQTVALSGVEYDDAMLKIKRAEVVNGMEMGAKQHEAEGIKTGLDLLSRKESEMNAQKSEDKNLAAGKESEQLSHRREMTKAGLNFIGNKQKTETGAKIASQKVDRAGKPGYNERGGKGNNQL